MNAALALPAIALALLFASGAAAAPPAMLCAGNTGLLVLNDACNLAKRLGEPATLDTPRDADGLVLRFFIARPFRQASIQRIDIRSASEGTFTVRSGGFVTMDKTVRLEAGEIALIRKTFAQSEFVDMHAKRDCEPDVFVLVEAVEHDRYRTAMLCSPDDKFPVMAVVDELFRDNLN